MLPLARAPGKARGPFLHFLLASEISMLGTSIPLVMEFAKSNDMHPLLLGMIWTFAAGGKLFAYQSGVLIVGYSYGYFAARDLGSNRAPSRYGLIGRHNRELAFASWFHGGARGNGPGCSGVVAESGVPPKMRRASEGRPGGLSS